MRRAGSERDSKMSAIYADHPLPWSTRLRIYRRAVQGWLAFFLLSATCNYLLSEPHGFVYAAILILLALFLVPTLVLNSALVRGCTIIFLLVIGFLTQAVNSLHEPHGIMMAGLVIITSVRLGWFHENGWLKVFAIVPLAIVSLYSSTAELLATPSSGPSSFWGILNQLFFVAALLYQLFYLAWFPDKYTRRKLCAAEMERDIYKHELRRAHTTIAQPRVRGTITQHLDAIDTMASDDLPGKRANEYHRRTGAIRRTISYLVRKHFSALIGKTSDHSHRCSVQSNH